jgi:hypothetical protein
MATSPMNRTFSSVVMFWLNCSRQIRPLSFPKKPSSRTSLIPSSDPYLTTWIVSIMLLFADTSGGILTAWSSSAFICIASSRTRHSLTLHLASTYSNKSFYITNIYAPSYSTYYSLDAWWWFQHDPWLSRKKQHKLPWYCCRLQLAALPNWWNSPSVFKL